MDARDPAQLDLLLARFDAEWLSMHSVTEDRRKTQLALLRRLAASMTHSLHRMTPTDIQGFIGAEMKAGISPHTGLKHLTMIRGFVTWLESADLISHTAMLRLKSVPNPRGSSVPKEPKPYKASEIRAFHDLMRTRLPSLPTHGKDSQLWSSFKRRRGRADEVPLRGPLRAYARRLQFEAQVALALEAGLRRIEIHRLSIPAMHFDNDDLVVLSAKKGPGQEVHRAIPYTTHARSCVRQWLDFRYQLEPAHDFPWLYLSSHSHGLGVGLECQLQPEPFLYLREKLPRTFGPGWRWHRFRHTAATEWLRSGVPLEKVQVFMGHANIAQTLRYTQILKRDIAKEFSAAEDDFARRLGLAA